MKTITYAAAVAALGLICLAGCSGKSKDTATHGDLTPLAPSATLAVADSVAGIAWGMPDGWTDDTLSLSTMRVATYMAAPVAGDSAPAECRINYFGADQGGTIEQNIQRWQSQYIADEATLEMSKPTVTTATIGAMAVTLVELQGTFVGSMMPMSEKLHLPGSHMFAAVVVAPQGLVFFKMMGPEKTVQANREAFRTMLGSIVARENSGT